MKKPKTLNFILDLQIYPFDIMFSFGESDDELKKKLKKHQIDWDDKMLLRGMGRYVLLPLNQSLIRLKYYPKTNQDYGILHHEIFHAVTYILDKIGMELKLGKSDEAYSYLIGYITEQVYNRL